MPVLKSQSRYYPSVWHTSFSAALRRRSWTRWTQHHHLAVCWPEQNWGQLHTPEKHTHTHTHIVANIFFESFQLYASFLFFSWWGFCLEEHTIPGYGLPIRNRSLVPVPGEGSKARVREESWGSCSLRRTMSVHSWGEFDLMRICSTVPLRIQACRWRIYVLIYILRKFDECHSFFSVFSNQHLVWWGSKLPEKPWVMSELRCEWVTVWQW